MLESNSTAYANELACLTTIYASFFKLKLEGNGLYNFINNEYLGEVLSNKMFKDKTY